MQTGTGMINQIYQGVISRSRALYYSLIYQHEMKRDGALLRRQFPQLGSFEELAHMNYDRLLPSYRTYIDEVSQKDMAISLELSVFLLTLCNLIKPNRIIDIGSGFSSYVLRYYARHAEIKPLPWSVDTEAGWLEKTRSFLLAHDLSGENMETWESFVAISPGEFDLIVYDLGDIHLRLQVLEYVLRLVSPKGMVILDDMQKQIYGPPAKAMVRKLGYHLYTLRSYTRDEFGRFSSLAVRGCER